jgi:hypothetical protein
MVGEKRISNYLERRVMTGSILEGMKETTDSLSHDSYVPAKKKTRYLLNTKM